MKAKQNKGFASMTAEQKSSIARLGGKSHSKEHMQSIGRTGGLRSTETRRAKRDAE